MLFRLPRLFLGLWTLAVLSGCATTTPQSLPPQPVRAMTFNIRLNTADDGLNAWKYRKQAVRDLLLFYEVDLLGIQEGLKDQVAFLDSIAIFGREGVGRDDGRDAGEFSAIYYRKSRFERIEGGTFWLSETPDLPSKGWDAALNRVCTWVRLKDRLTGQVWSVMNTHFDHKGELARIKAAALIRARAQQMAGDQPILILGDFNLTPETQPIQEMQAVFADAFLHSARPPYGPIGTFNAFQVQQAYERRIDYVFVNKKLSVLQYQTLAEVRSGGFFLSDHFPVLVHLEALSAKTP